MMRNSINGPKNVNHSFEINKRQLSINDDLMAKYRNHFRFFQIKQINDIIFHHRNTTNYKTYKQVLRMTQQSELMKRYYRSQKSQNYQIQKHLQILTEFYSQGQRTTYEYPTMILTNTKDIFEQRIRRKIRMTAAEDSENQFLRRRTLLKEGSGNFDLLADYDRVSFSNRSVYIKGDKNSQCNSSQVSFHDIYPEKRQIDSSMLIIDWMRYDQVIEDQVNHLICDFQDLEENKVIKQYQLIQLKKRKRNQNNENIKQIRNPQNKKNYNLDLKQALGFSALKKSQNIIKTQKSKKKNQQKQKLKDSKNSIEFRINITGTRDSQQYSAQISRLTQKQIKQSKKELIRKSVMNKTQNYTKDIYVSKKSHESRQNKKNNNEPKRFCLNLNTKEIFPKEQSISQRTINRDKYKKDNRLLSRQISSDVNKQKLNYCEQNQIQRAGGYISKYINGANLIQSTIVKGKLSEEKNQSIFSFGNSQLMPQTNKFISHQQIQDFSQYQQIKGQHKLSLNKDRPFNRIYHHFLTPQDEQQNMRTNLYRYEIRNKIKTQTQFQSLKNQRNNKLYF